LPPTTRCSASSQQSASDRHPSRGRLSKTLHDSLRDGLAAGRTEFDTDLEALFRTSFPSHNGWLVTPMDTYGTDCSKRDHRPNRLGACASDICAFPFALTDIATKTTATRSRSPRPPAARSYSTAGR
jgi:hypothetical protein